VQVNNEDEWKRTYIRTGLSDGLNLEVLEGVSPETELKGAKKETNEDEVSKDGE
jgi:hypothetical protein